MDEQSGSHPLKKATHRSPNYPAFDLSAALDKVRVVYDKDKRTPTTPEVIVSHLGYKHTDGPGGRAISCLRQFGLLEQASGNWRVSDAAFNLLHLSEADLERAKLLREAARRPNLYRQLIDEYPDGLPSDQTLKSNLIRREFNPDFLDSIISDLRSTIVFAKVYDVSKYEDKEESEMENLPVVERNKTPIPPIPMQAVSAGQKVYAFAFAGNGSAQLLINGEYTKEDLDDLDTLLKTTLNGLRRSLNASPKQEPVQ